MTQWIKMLTANSDDLSFISNTNTVEGKDLHSHTAPYLNMHSITHTCTHTNVILKIYTPTVLTLEERSIILASFYASSSLFIQINLYS